MWRIRRIRQGVIVYIGGKGKDMLIGGIMYRSDHSFELLFPLDDEDELKAKNICLENMNKPIDRKLVKVL